MSTYTNAFCLKKSTTDEFIHGFAKDSKYFYIASIETQVNQGYGPRIHITKVTRATNVVERSFYISQDQTGQTLQIQGVVADDVDEANSVPGAIYIFYDHPTGPCYIAKLRKLDFAVLAVKQISPCIYQQTGNLINTVHTAPQARIMHVGDTDIINGNVKIWSHLTSDLTVDNSGIFTGAWVTGDMTIAGCIYQDPVTPSLLYVTGSALIESNAYRVPMLYRITQGITADHQTLTAQSAVYFHPYDEVSGGHPEWIKGTGLANLNTALMGIAFDSSYSSNRYIWATGIMPKHNESTIENKGGDLFVAQINSPVSGNMTIQAVWRFHHTTDYSIKGCAITQDASYIYVNTAAIQHNGLGDDFERSNPAKAFVLKIDKAKLPSDLSHALVWCLGFGDANETSRSSSCVNGLQLESSILYDAISTNIQSLVDRDPGILMVSTDPYIDKAYYSRDGKVAQMVETSNITATALVHEGEVLYVSTTSLLLLSAGDGVGNLPSGSTWGGWATESWWTVDTFGGQFDNNAIVLKLRPCDDSSHDHTRRCYSSWIAVEPGGYTHSTWWQYVSEYNSGGTWTKYTCTTHSLNLYVGQAVADAWKKDEYIFDRVTTAPDGRIDKVVMHGKIGACNTPNNNRESQFKYHIREPSTANVVESATTDWHGELEQPPASDRYIECSSEWTVDQWPADANHPRWRWDTHFGSATGTARLRGGFSTYNRQEVISWNNSGCDLLWMDVWWTPYIHYEVTGSLGPTITGDGGVIFGFYTTDSGAGTDSTPSIAVGVPLTDSAHGADITPGIGSAFTTTDSGSGSDTFSISVTFSPLTDSGSATDLLYALSAALGPISDTFAGVDSLSHIDVAFTITDSATGTETPSITCTLSVSDSATASDIIDMFQRLISVIETSTGVDTVQNLTCTFTLTDSTTGVETIFAGNLLTVTDSALGTEEPIGKAVLAYVIDSFIGVENISNIAVSFTTTDSGVGSETPTISCSLTTTDSALGTETVLAITLVTATDSALGTDTIPTLSVLSSVLDSALGNENVFLSFRDFTVTDTSIGTETASVITVSFTLSDSSTGTDIVTAITLITIIDAFLATDILSNLSVQVSQPDSGIATELITLTAIIPISDSGLATEEIPISVTFPVIEDFGTLTDILDVIKIIYKTVTDSALLTDDVTSVNVNVTVTENLQGTDEVAITVDLSIPDFASVIELITPEVTGFTIYDSATGSDNIFMVELMLTITDSVTASDAISNIMSLLSITESGVLTDIISRSKTKAIISEVTAVIRYPRMTITIRQPLITIT